MCTQRRKDHATYPGKVHDGTRLSNSRQPFCIVRSCLLFLLQIERREVESHLDSAVRHHLDMACGRLVSALGQINDLKAKVEDLQRRFIFQLINILLNRHCLQLAFNLDKTAGDDDVKISGYNIKRRDRPLRNGAVFCTFSLKTYGYLCWKRCSF